MTFPDYYIRVYDAVNDTVRETSLDPGFIFSRLSFSASAGAGNNKAVFASDIFHVFDVAANTWTDGPATNRTAGISATSVGTKAVFAGGVNTESTTITASDRVDIYDASTGAFTIGPALAGGARYFIAAASVGTKALLVGGQHQIGTSISGQPIFGPSDAVDIYDSATGTWSAGPPLAGGARSSIVALTVGTRLNHCHHKLTTQTH